MKAVINRPGYFLGVDVGASKTHVLIADHLGCALGFAQGKGANPNQIGYEGLAQVLLETVGAALNEAGASKAEIEGAGFGIAGYDWHSQLGSIMGAIKPLGLAAPIGVVNDALLGLLAGSKEGWGVGIVAGTSCNCWGLDRDRRVGRMTGFSWLGEHAGSYELVVKAIQAIAKEWTLRGPPTDLTQAFIAHLGAKDIEELLERLSKKRLELDPLWAKIVFQVAEGGDEVATALVRWAGEELGNLAVGVIHQLRLEGMAFEVVLAGSFFKGSPVLERMIASVVHNTAPQAEIVRLDAPPVVGGVLLGMEKAGLEPWRLRERLIGSLRARLSIQEQ